ncbi:hypothetical protein [Actinomadura citrea]|uniref:Uncharacterized protein n=1 Tax=Actinomadura citrea TaxID=46158 RepID=A0A7Y9KBR3_9ACTN|nr:hypothetical protein [Actinomadura citrea]NYE10238.1 hypothetical protein [Actinomadura citrea]
MTLERPRTAPPRRPRGVSPFGVLMAVFGLGLMLLVIPNAGPVLRASQTGKGTPGVFTARERSCIRHPGHEACTLRGAFRSDDGSVERPTVALYGSGKGLREGGGARARDVGRSGTVYLRDASHEWIMNVLLLAAGGLLIFVGLRRLPARRGREAGSPVADE